MICVDMDGRLGNEMFQYASGRAIAVRQGLRFAYARHRHSLEDAFDLPGGRLGNTILRLASIPLRRTRFYKVCKPKMRTMIPGYEFETFDETLFSCGPFARIIGYLETPEYIAGMEDQVRSWFRFRDVHQRRVREIEGSLALPPELRCCVHVRRTDLLGIRYPIAHLTDGLALPIGYYAAALARVPEEVGIVVNGDEVDFVRPLLSARPFVHYSRDEGAPVDMALMGICRWNVISNSTFAWWSAWLNARPDRRLIGPRYFRGWHVRQWEMPGLAVEDWDWIDWR
ncbi:MAG TPA: alpha-1,2-fucosyltransferase [Opitutaceae bacterium]